MHATELTKLGSIATGSTANRPTPIPVPLLTSLRVPLSIPPETLELTMSISDDAPSVQALERRLLLASSPFARISCHATGLDFGDHQPKEVTIGLAGARSIAA